MGYPFRKCCDTPADPRESHLDGCRYSTPPWTADAERAAIVKWLRGEALAAINGNGAPTVKMMFANEIERLADAIHRNEHLKEG